MDRIQLLEQELSRFRKKPAGKKGKKPKSPGVPLQDDVIEAGPPVAEASSAYFTRAMNPGVIIAGAGLGISTGRDIMNNKGDITWDLKALDGSYHPLHSTWSKADQKKFGTKPWKKKTQKIYAGFKTHSTAVISATFELSWQYNGHYVANVDVEPVGNNDLIMWGLHVTGRLIKDQGPYYHSKTGAGPFARIDYSFNYRFSRSIGEDVVMIGRYNLYGDGQIAYKWRNTQ